MLANVFKCVQCVQTISRLLRQAGPNRGSILTRCHMGVCPINAATFSERGSTATLYMRPGGTNNLSPRTVNVQQRSSISRPCRGYMDCTIYLYLYRKLYVFIVLALIWSFIFIQEAFIATMYN